MDIAYMLAERLPDYSARIIRRVERLTHTRAGNRMAGQLLRQVRVPALAGLGRVNAEL